MIDLFNIAKAAPNDKSLEYLTKIFGLMHGVLYNPNQAPNAPPAGDITLLSTLFRTFNTVLLAVGVLIIVYVIITNVLRTAHEGEVMGRQGSALWIPIRMVLGIAGLFPMASGYCALQIIMMWVIVQGIGAADNLWGTALAVIDKTGSPYVQPTVPSTGVPQTIENMFTGMVCEATLHESNSVSSAAGIGNYYCAQNPNNPFCKPLQAVDLTQPQATPGIYKFGPADGVCGTLSYCDTATACPNNNTNSLSCKMCKAQQAVLSDIIGQQRVIAQYLVQADYTYRMFYYNKTSPEAAVGGTQWVFDYCSANNIARGNCCLTSDPDNPKCQSSTGGVFPKPNDVLSGGQNLDPKNANKEAITSIFWPYYMKPLVQTSPGSSFITAEANYYHNALTETLSIHMAQLGSNIENLQEDKRNAASTGWLFAGAFYYTIGNSMKNPANSTKNAIPTLPTFTPGDIKSIDSNIRVNNTAATALLDAVREQEQSATTTNGGAAGGGGYSKALKSQNALVAPLVNWLAGLMNDLSNSFTNAVSKGGNPMFVIQTLGMNMLIITEIAFGVIVLLTAVAAIVGNISAYVLGTGITNPLGPALLTILILIVPALYGLLGILAAYGGLLGIYVPLIPFIVFTGGAITWFLLVIEAIVAAPLVAIGIMMPGGHHEVMGRAEPALMMLLNIFLRPSLMVLGMLAGMLLSTVLLNMIFYTFWNIVIPTTSTVSGSLVLAWIFYLGAFVALTVTVVNKSYATIHLLPDRVITWIGGHAAQLGVEAEMDREGKGAVEKTGHGVSGAAQATMGAIEKAGGKNDHFAEAKGKMDKDKGSTGEGTTKTPTATGAAPPDKTD